jgi:hypothetical protein
MVAICSMVRKPFNFDTWIKYHLSIGFDYIFLKVEDTPELVEIIQKYPNVVSEFSNLQDNFNNYWTLIDRQIIFIESLRDKLISLNVDWIFHIDTDELICCNDVKSVLDNVSNEYQTVIIKNYEAVYSDDSLSNPFYQTNLFKNTGYVSYCNGKSASRVNQSMIPKGSHRFGGKKCELSTKEVVVLHFESATFDIWYEKFSNESNGDEKKLSEIPFDFYKESINLIKIGSKEEAREFYNKMKVNVGGSLMKLFWTPQIEDKNIVWTR